MIKMLGMTAFVILPLVISACGITMRSHPASESVVAVLGSPTPDPASPPLCTTSVPGSLVSGLTYYTNNVYPIVSDTNRCALCHVPGVQSPNLGDPSSVANSYSAATSIVASFASIQRSLLWTYGITNHHCGASPKNCDDSQFSGNLAVALNNWALAEQGLPIETTVPCATPTPSPEAISPSPTPALASNGFTLVGPPVSVATGIVNANLVSTPLSATLVSATPAPAPTYLVFDLSQAGYTGAKLYFLILRDMAPTATTNGAYYLANPTIVSNVAFQITGVHITLINSTPPGGPVSSEWSGWDPVSRSVPINATFPGTSLTTPIFLIIPSLGVTGDTFQLSVKSF